MSSLKRKKPNLDAVLESYLQKSKAKVTRETSETCVQDHPEYPSLLTISDCLTEWKIPNVAYRIERKDYDPSELEFPLIAHFQEYKDGSFILVNEITNGQVHYSNEISDKEVMTEELFLSKWDGIILYAVPDENSTQENYKSAKSLTFLNRIKYPLSIIVALGLIFLLANSVSYQIPTLLLALIKLSGISVSVLLLIHSIDSNNPLVQNLCSLGKKNNCNAVLKSDDAKVTDWLSWSEVGFFYFTGSFIALFLAPGTIWILGIINLCCLPYTIWSIRYQYMAKNWCTLCCTVQALLWIEFAVFLYNYNGLHTFEISSIVSLILSFAIPVVAWTLLKPSFLGAALVKPLKQQLKTFKYNTDLFQKVLTNQPRFAISDDLMPLVLGNPEAETVITMVSNPFCGPCATAHKTLDSWLSQRDDIQVKVIFTTSDRDDDEKTKVARHISALSKFEDKHLAETALNDWYDSPGKDYKLWAEKFPVIFNEEVNKVTQRQKEWCDLTEITFTPTILINGYKLPDQYRLTDIKYLLV